MTLTGDCMREDLGVYALGALTVPERSRVDAHLQVCSACRGELDELADVTAFLAMLTPGEGELLLGADDPGDTAGVDMAVADLAEFRRRRKRRRDAWLSAAALLIVAAGGASLLAGQPWASGQGASQVQAGGQSYGTAAGGWRTATGTSAGASVTVMYRAMDWGTWVAAKVNGIAPGTRCSIAVVTPAGTLTTVANWTTDAMVGKVWYPGSAAIAASDVRGFVLTIGNGQQVTVQAQPFTE